MKLNLKSGLISVIFALSGNPVLAKTSFDHLPVPKKGGTFNDVTIANPMTLNPIIANSIDDVTLTGYFFMSLMGRDMQTYEDIPGLAEKVEVSKDKKEYTYTLFKNAKWSDGTPVTSDDVEFTLNKIMDTKVDAAATRSFMGGVTFQKIDALKFKFIVAVPKYNSLSALNTFVPVQKKQFEKEADFNKSKENLRPIGNSAYKLKAISRDQHVTIERDLNWWAKDFKENKAQANFDLIQFKIIPDQALSYENFMRGSIDTMNFLADQYATQVKGVDKDKFGDKPDSGKNLWAKEFKSDGSMPWYSLRLNLKNPILSSLNVRKALAYLVDYNAVIERGYFNTVYQSISPFGSRTDNTPPELKSGAKTFKLDPKKAASLLKEDGWADTDQDGLLDKVINGKKMPLKLEVKLAAMNTSGMKAVQIFKESFKKSGIELSIRALDVPALFKDIDERNFELIFMGWGGGNIHPDPKQIWHSESIAHGGSNMVGYSNPKVDQLIEKANLEFDRKKRAKMLQEIAREIYNDVPYIFLVERGSIFQGFNSKVKSPIWSQRYSTAVTKEFFHF